MPSHDTLFIANWKIQLSYNQSITFGLTHKNDLIKLTDNPLVHLVICPAFPALNPLISMFHSTSIAIGAQTCSPFTQGAYTGEVSALMLAQIGCRYCIVGHSERRSFCHETDLDIAQKTALLLSNGVHPIICVGETKEENERPETKKVVTSQLQAVAKHLHAVNLAHKPLCVAYEPRWAIGTGITPTIETLQDIFTWLEDLCKQLLPTTPVTLIYGGSVAPENIAQFRDIAPCRGFLIGTASTDFTKLKNIVCLYGM